MQLQVETQIYKKNAIGHDINEAQMAIRAKYAISNNEASEADKIAIFDPPLTNWSLFKGAEIFVKFKKATYSSEEEVELTLTLKSSNEDTSAVAYPIKDSEGNDLLPKFYWEDNSTVHLMFDGQYWRVIDWTQKYNNFVITTENFKSEYGSKTTALEGTVSTHTTKLNQTSDSITSLAQGNTTYVDPISGEPVTSSIGTKVQQTANNVLIQATSKVDGSSETAENAGAALIQSFINVAPDKIKINAGKVNITGTTIFTAVNADDNARAAMLNSELKIGVRNLLRNTANVGASGNYWSVGGWYSSGGGGTITTGVSVDDSPIGLATATRLTSNDATKEIGAAQGGVPLIGGKTVTLSAWVKGTAGDRLRFQPVWANASGTVPESGSEYFTIAASDDNKWVKYSFTKSVNYDHPIGNDTSRATNTYANAGYVMLYHAEPGHTALVTGVKLEYGNVATDWLPAQEDVQTQIDGAAPKSEAIKRTQRIYYRTNRSTPPPTPGTATENWVTNGNVDNDDEPWEKYDHWSTRVPPMADDVNINLEGGTTKYLYLWTCEQKEVISANNPISYTEVLLDESNTIINGGNIITGSITANQLNAADINGWRSLSIGAFKEDEQNNILNSKMLNIQTYEGHIVSFNNENNALIQKAIVTIEPLQSGRGTPGINNVRAINGWNNIDIGVSGKNLLSDSTNMADWYVGSNTIISDGVASLVGTSSDWSAMLGTAKYSARIYDGTTKYVWSFDYKSTADCSVLGVIASTNAGASSPSFFRTNYTNWKSTFTLPNSGGVWTRYVFDSRTIDLSQLTSGSGLSRSGYLQIYNRTDGVTLEIRNMQLEIGETGTNYEAYNGSNYNILLSGTDVIYGGTLDITTGILRITKKSLFLDGSTIEGSTDITKFQGKGGNTSGDHYYVTVDDGYLFNTTRARWVTEEEGVTAGMLCNYGPFLNGSGQSALSYNAYISDNGTKLRLYMCFPTDMNLNTLDLANTWLETHNLRFVYPLATPIVRILSPQQITTLLGTNNIWVDSGSLTVQVAYGSNDIIQALTLLNESDDSAAKQVTNFIGADYSGIMVYDGRSGIKQTPSHVIEGTHNVLIDQNSIDIRTGTTTHASFGKDGLKLYLPGDKTNPIAQYGATTIIGQENSFHIEIDSQQLGFYDGKRTQDKPAIAYIKQDKMFIEKSVVAQSLSVGRTQLEEDQLGNKGKGQWSWQVHEVNKNGKNLNNLSLKWMG